MFQCVHRGCLVALSSGPRRGANRNRFYRSTREGAPDRLRAPEKKIAPESRANSDRCVKIRRTSRNVAEPAAPAACAESPCNG
ncbi:hypothetical protein C7S16_3159 [Burkholderia thailandensis]|uniref:Uncharacterized protein n=1 Tax=Burkholderia thailandensis TaxID=57975 RepID=A0AAW9D2S2_BURTH|nr:hypothetical protein [Burkholderia thailandensis]